MATSDHEQTQSESPGDGRQSPVESIAAGRMTGSKLDWASDDDTSMSVVQKSEGHSSRRSVRRSAQSRKKASKAVAASVKNTTTQHLVAARKSTGTHTINEAGDRIQASSAAEKHERVTSDDELEPEANEPLPAYLQQRFQAVRQRNSTAANGPIRLPPALNAHSLGQRSELQFKPAFKHFLPCSALQDIHFSSPGPGLKSNSHAPLYAIGVVPGTVAQWLRDYQVRGAHFLLERFAWQQGGILGDDMGLGKTIQVIAFLTAAFGKVGESRDLTRRRTVRSLDASAWYPRVLIICPGTLMDNWASELSTWGFWQLDKYHGSSVQREAVLSAAKSGSIEIVITTYQTYRLNHDHLNLVEWDCVVADECHIIKERTSLITQAMNSVNAMCRIGLTGTAIQNNYNELWTLLNWSNPGAVSTYTSWKTLISNPLRQGQAHDATTYDHGVGRRTAIALKNELLPRFFLRRWKSLIAHQLPKKSDRVVFCPLTVLQVDAYKTFLESSVVDCIRNAGLECECGSKVKAGWCCKQFVDNDPDKPWTQYTFPAIHALRNMANHLALLIPDHGQDEGKYERGLDLLRCALPHHWNAMMRQKDSIHNLNNREYCGKFDVLLMLLAWWHERGDKVLVFSHSVKLLRGLRLLFSSTSYSCSYLDGSMSYEDRTLEVDKFNKDEQQFVFLISVRAGGVGLNITSANKVVILDPNWNPAHDLQAQDRAYRIGQTRDVDVFRLVSIGTVEETIYARQIYKQQQASIAYNASLERRYFSGIQGDQDKKGELFGLQNLFTYHDDRVILQSILNKTNVAECKAGCLIADIDLAREDDPVAKNGSTTRRTGNQSEDGHDPTIKAFATILNTKGSAASAQSLLGSPAEKEVNADGIEHILAQAGVQYSHDNAEVIGSSRIEAKLSARAMSLAYDGTADGEVLFDDKVKLHNTTSLETFRGTSRGRKYHPPEDVRVRQFCSMARMAGMTTIEFALRAEKWSQKSRRDFLDKFYSQRVKDE